MPHTFSTLGSHAATASIAALPRPILARATMPAGLRAELRAVGCTVADAIDRAIAAAPAVGRALFRDAVTGAAVVMFMLGMPLGMAALFGVRF